MAIDLISNCIVQYKMNDNTSSTAIVDSIGTYNDSIFVGGNTNTKSVTGIINRALTFNSYDYINTSETFNSIFVDSFSINLWFKPDDGQLDSSQQDLFGSGTSGTEIFEIVYGVTDLSVEYNSGFGNSVSVSGAHSFGDGQSGWHMLTFVIEESGNNATGILYLDGNSIGISSLVLNANMSTRSSSRDTYIGKSNRSGTAPFAGDLDNFCIFDKAIIDGEIQFLYNNGVGTELFAPVITISAPTIYYPNGGEIFTEGDINVQWIEPGGLSATEIIWYEIFIVDDYNDRKKQELIQIATIPSGNTSYSYTIEKNLRGTKSRIGIRSVNNKGERSGISFSADDFTIINEFLPSPALMEPVHSNTYFSYIPFIFDHNGVTGRCSQRSFYQIYYKSDNQNLDWTLLKSNIMVGTDPINIDVSDFNTNSDYVFKIELVDGDNISPPVFIDNININNINLFLIDTTPPTGTIKIVNNEEYTKDKGLILEISASDGSTGVKDVQIQQTNTVTGETNHLDSNPFVPLTPLLTWDIKPEGNNIVTVDGVKLIQARFRDYGNNTLIVGSDKYFRTYKSLENREVTSFIYDTINSYLYSAFAGNETTGALAELYRDLTFISTLDGDATSLEMYNNTLYIGIKDDENKGILQRLTSGAVSTISDNENQYLDAAETVVNSLYSTDSVINAMEVFNNVLFLGLDNGKILSFKGSSVALEHSSYSNIRSVRNIRTDGIMLYIFFHNTTEILIMNEDVSGNYTFSTVDTED